MTEKRCPVCNGTGLMTKQDSGSFWSIPCGYCNLEQVGTNEELNADPGVVFTDGVEP